MSKRRPTRLWILLVTATLVSAGLAVAPGAVAFDDVVAGKFYEEPVDWMAAEGITTGRTPTIFDPDAPVTRGEVATFIWRFAHEPAAAAASGFSDVEAGRFYTDSIDWMAETGITTGRTATIFDPQAPVTRGEVATFLWRYMCKPAATAASGFTDVDAGRFYTDPIEWLAETGITTGRTATIFDPDAPVTRGEVATFIWRLAGMPATTDPGANRVTLAPGCDGTPPPAPPGVGTLTVMSALALGDVGVNVGTDTSITLTNSGASGSPRITVTSVTSSDGDVTLSFTPVSLSPGESVIVSVNVTPSEVGSLAASITASHSGANGPTSVVAVSASGVPGVIHKINAGGAAVADWTADPSGSPSPYHNMTGSQDKVAATVSAIAGAGAVPEAVYQTARTDHRSSISMEWDLPLPVAGYHLVTLHFARISTSHDQVNVDIEGTQVLRGFDPSATTAIDAAVTRSFVVMADTNLDIDLGHTFNLKDTYINGIEVAALGTAPDGYVSVAPVLADLGSVATTVGMLSKSIAVTNLGSTPVSIASIAPSGDFSTTTGSLTIAGGASELFSVDFDPSVDGLQSQWLDLKVPNADLGVDLVGHGGVAATARVDILPGFTTVDATVFDVGSIVIRNNSATESITSISFDTTGALIDDVAFDVDDGTDIGVGSKDWQHDFSPVAIASQSGVNGQTYTVGFSGFIPGQSVFASVDIDPLSTTGEVSNGLLERGATVNGLELVGTKVTVVFSGGGSATTTLWNSGAKFDSSGLLAIGANPTVPAISIAGQADGSMTGSAGGHIVDVTGCTAGDTLTLLQVEAEQLFVGGSVGLPAPTFGGNRILDHVSSATTTCLGGGTASFVIASLSDSTPADPHDGWNHFMVLQGDTSTGLVTASDRIAIRYDS